MKSSIRLYYTVFLFFAHPFSAVRAYITPNLVFVQIGINVHEGVFVLTLIQNFRKWLNANRAYLSRIAFKGVPLTLRNGFLRFSRPKFSFSIWKIEKSCRDLYVVREFRLSRTSSTERSLLGPFDSRAIRAFCSRGRPWRVICLGAALQPFGYGLNWIFRLKFKSLIRSRR